MLRDRQVTVSGAQKPPCHVTEQTSHKKDSYETITRDVARAGGARGCRVYDSPLFVSFESIFTPSCSLLFLDSLTALPRSFYIIPFHH